MTSSRYKIENYKRNKMYMLFANCKWIPSNIDSDVPIYYFRFFFYNILFNRSCLSVINNYFYTRRFPNKTSTVPIMNLIK